MRSLFFALLRLKSRYLFTAPIDILEQGQVVRFHKAELHVLLRRIVGCDGIRSLLIPTHEIDASALALCSMAGEGTDGEFAYSRCATREHCNKGALGEEGGVGCAHRLQRKLERGHDGVSVGGEFYQPQFTSS